jgi:hypothetical protein
MAATQEQGVSESLGANVQRLFLNFLEEYREDDGVDGVPSSQGEPTYVRCLRELKEQDRTTLFVDFNHLLECEPRPRCLHACTLTRAAPQVRRAAGARGRVRAVLPLRALPAQGCAGAHARRARAARCERPA